MALFPHDEPVSEAVSATQPITRVRVVRHDGSGLPELARDPLAVEQPLEVRVQGVLLCVTMRTPGHDAELARGLVSSERVVSAGDILRVSRCERLYDSPRYDDVIDVRLRDGAGVDPGAFRRLGAVSSSCGVCGQAEIDRLASGLPRIAIGRRVEAARLAALPSRMRREQPLFRATGGTHAAALFDADGALHVLREDIGRHNAVDKVVGHAAAVGIGRLADHTLCVSGRVSFDIAQKAFVAGIGTIVAVSAPSSLAVSLCERGGITLAAFAREGRLSVYSHGARVGAA